jgi:hypothetical protein
MGWTENCAGSHRDSGWRGLARNRNKVRNFHLNRCNFHRRAPYLRANIPSFASHGDHHD